MIVTVATLITKLQKKNTTPLSEKRGIKKNNHQARATSVSLKSRQALNTVQSIPKGSKPAQLQQQLRSNVSAPNAWHLGRLCPTICDPAISPGQTVLETKVSCSQWEVSACTHEGSSFFLFGGWRFYVFFLLFSSCSQRLPQVPKLFLKTFPIAPQFYPIWFCPKFNSHAIQTRKAGHSGAHLLNVATWGLKRCLMFQRNWWWAN
jgi:hypothetical protein